MSNGILAKYITKEFTVIYLCVKEHKITKLKYFCKTTKKDPVRYLGSGKYWRDHLKIHGRLVETLEVWQFDKQEDCTKFALDFSEKFDIVHATNENGQKIWANLRPENGIDGNLPGYEGLTGEKNGMYNKTHTEENKEYFRLLATGREHSKESKQKRSIKLSGSGNPMYGKKHSAESTKKRKEWSSKNSQNMLEKGTHPFNDINKRKLENGIHPSQLKVTCLTCQEESSFGMFTRWHGNKCRGPKDNTPKIRSCETKWTCVCGKSGIGSSNYSRWHNKCVINLGIANQNA
jgi:hypothetical protein